MCSSALAGSDLRNIDNVDRATSGSVTSSHLTVELGDSGTAGHVTVFLVHVVDTASAVVLNPDTEVLDSRWLLVVNFDAFDDLTAALLHLLQLSNEIPVTALGGDEVRSEDTHLVWSRVGKLL